MNTSIPVIVDLIASITGLPKAGEDPVQYIHGSDINKRIAKQLKERFGLQSDHRAYRMDRIHSQKFCISARILASKVVRGN